MSNSLLKKVTSAVVLTAMVASTVGAVSSTYAATTEVEAANALAAAGVIADQSSNVSAYRLGDTITRREMLKVMVNLAGLTVENKCEGKFADLPATDWGCKYAETALAAGYIAANTNFRPNDNVSKAEALKMVMKATGVEKDSTAGLSWEAAYVKAAVAAGLITASFSDYTTASKRGFTFTAAANATEEDDLGLDDILDDTDDTTDTTDDTTTLPTGDLEVSLSASTPAGADLPQGADGVEVLNFDLTAGSSDAALTDLTFERTGFGEDAANSVYLFTDAGRVTKAKTFNSDDEANVTVSPALVVKAGETVTVRVLVDTDSATGEFAINLKTVNGEAVSGITSNTFDVKSVAATKLNFNTGSVDTTITAGEIQATVAEFDLENDGNVANSDVTVSSITLKENGTIDEENLENLTLVVSGKEVATASMNGRYVTFNLDTPILVEDGETETFTVKADIMGGADETILFVLDANGDISASATKYTGVNVVNNYAGTEVSVEAGELTLYAVDATNDKVRDDTDNVVLGQLKVVNVAGENLELKNLGVSITTSSAILSTIENVQLELNGTSYDLYAPSNTSTSATSAVYSETDLDIVLPQGTTVFNVVADTLADLSDATTIDMSLDASSTTTFKVEETDQDTVVTDITPSTLNWDAIEIDQPSATVSNVPLANVSVVKGTSDITALQFEVKANEVSALAIDKVIVDTVALTSTSAVLTNYKDHVSSLRLYKGSVTEANLLDSVSGTNIASNGNVTFDGFNTTVAANATETFVVVISTVDTDAVINNSVAVNLVSLDVEDDNNDNVPETGVSSVSGKTVTLKDSGTLTLTDDATNSSNEEAKTILAGNEVAVYSVDAKATNEAIKLEEVAFALTGATFADMQKVVKSAKLYMGDTLIDTASNSDVVANYDSYATGVYVVFEDMTAVVPTTSTELKLVLVTENIGYEKIGTDVSGVTVESTIVLAENAKGENSNSDIASDEVETATSAKEFAVVPGVVTPAITNTFATDDINSTMTINVDFGANTKSSDGSALTATLTGLTLAISSVTATGTVTLFNGNGTQIATDTVNVGDTTAVFNFGTAQDAITNGESYRIETTAQASFRLATNGVKYSVDGVDYTTNLKTTVDMGTYTKSN